MKKLEHGVWPKRASHRSAQLASLLQQLLAEACERTLELTPGILVTITSVAVTNDLHEARVGVSVLPFSHAPEIFARVQSKVHELQHYVNGRVTSYRVPKLVFFLDEGEERAGKVLGILDRLKPKG